MKAELVPTAVIPEAERVERADDRPPMGSWWWLKATKADDDHDHPPDRKGQFFVCVVELGSNYVKLEGLHYRWRLSYEEFLERGEAEPMPLAFINSKIDEHRGAVRRLMAKIQEVCHKLGIPMQQALSAPTETTALAVAHGIADVKKHQKALVKAKEKTLPELFKQVKEQHEQMAVWMKVELMPLKAELARTQTDVIDVVNKKIHTVELYAGLQEELVQVREGEPAKLDAKVYLIQHRHYMDEECLAQYEAGGMDFKNLKDFDKWIGRDENMARILPHERCIVAFRIRRYSKSYGSERDTLSNFIKFGFWNEANKQTFLYIRNGRQLWRMATSIDFDSDLFPNKDDSELLGDDELWFQASGVDLYKVISGRWRLGMIKVWQERRNDLARELWAWKKLGKPEGDWIMPGSTEVSFIRHERIVGHQHGRPHDYFMEADWKNYKRVEPESIYYEDVIKHVAGVAFEHNRVAVVIQGLLDRSTCLHPHPPWKIWTLEGFTAGIELVYSHSRAIAPVDVPDWEGYAKQLRKSVRVGAYVMGHYPIWREEMKDRYGKEWGWRMGNGPARIAQVAAIRGGKACFKFTRTRHKAIRYEEPVPGEPGWVYKRRKYPEIPVSWWCEIDKLFCVDAYTPGDFRIFFDDPRTRADYLEWAPWLLSAEDWHHRRKLKPDHGEDDDAEDVGDKGSY